MATNTYVALDKVTVTGSSTPSITFSSIPQGYTDLVLVCSSVDSVLIYARLGNGSVDSGTNYSYTYLVGDGSGTASGRGANSTKGFLSLSSDVVAKQYQTITNFQNYSNTTTNKTFLTRYSDSAIYAAAVVNLWRSTAAINIITVYGDGANIPAGSTFSLYGIAAAGVSPAAKATGGTIYSDDQYYYHVFGSTGTFTPLQSLSADVLVVAGGGGGGVDNGGAGGAGGLSYQSARSLTATGYSITIGAGGAAGTSGGTKRGSSGSNSVFDTITSNGGGGGGEGTVAGVAGGSGGAGGYGASGGAANQGNTGGATGFGFAGGASSGSSPYACGGGGGAGAIGATGSGTTAGVGGIGASAYSSWGVATGMGESVSGTYYFAGGGGGSIAGANAGGLGGSGGGGKGSGNSTAAINALANTGGGGGGGVTSPGTAASAGGSGVVIVRYTKA
jgi:hypothetical protein